MKAKWRCGVFSYRSVRPDPPLYALTPQCTVSPHCALMHTFSYFSAMPRVYTRKKTKQYSVGDVERAYAAWRDGERCNKKKTLNPFTVIKKTLNPFTAIKRTINPFTAMKKTIKPFTAIKNIKPLHYNKKKIKPLHCNKKKKHQTHSLQ